MNRTVIGSWRITRDRRGRYSVERFEFPWGSMTQSPCWCTKRRFQKEFDAEAWIRERCQREWVEIIASYSPNGSAIT
jgi:hypothetical protein